MMIVAHLLPEYLLQGHSYIYDQIVNTTCDARVITRVKVNESHYPFQNIRAFLPSVTMYNVLNRISPRIIDHMAVPYFAHAIKKMHASVMHAHFGTFGSTVTSLRRKTDTPLIVTFYGIDASHYIRIPYWINKYKKMFHEGDRFIALCDEVKGRFIECGCPEHKIDVWDIGIDLDEYPYRERKRDAVTRFLITARFREKKGYPVLLRAFERLLKMTKEVHLTIIGYGPLKPFIESFVREKGIESYVKLIDTSRTRGEEFVTLFKDALYGSDIFILPSVVSVSGDDEGGPPVVITNAHASGLPVIATPVGGIERAVVDGKTGLLAEPGDEKVLCDKMELLVKNEALCRSMGIAGRKHMEENFDLVKQVRRLEDIYIKTAAGKAE